MPSANDLRTQAALLRGQLPERQQPKPPQETGRRIGTVPRSVDEEIRVNWCEYAGRPYLSLRLWTRDQQGQWWPDAKRGMSVRLRELADMADAIAAAMELAEDHQRQRPAEGGPGRYAGAHRDREPGRPDRAPRYDAPSPPTSGGQAGEMFDEFG
jgi:hypothetical protein